MTVTVTPLGTFRNETPYPFCPGCGHGSILDKLDTALVSLALDPRHVVIVSDIGCAGLSDQYFTTSAFHGLHGRSVTYATGIKLADPNLTVIVIMGDGGTGIGGAHLINAARRNIGVTVLVMNNLNFGMTGGQHSTTTPEGAVTSTTPGGNLEHPLDICGTVGVNGAAYVYRGTSFDEELPDRIADAIRHPGFALLDIWELCTAYYVRANRFSRKGIVQTMSDLGFARGVLYEREVTEYAAAYRAAHAADRPVAPPAAIPVEFPSRLTEPFTLVVAGSAGAKVKSAATTIGVAAIRSGLWASQRDDYPVTVKTGHSIATVVLSPDEQPISTVTIPDALVVLSEEGLRKVGGYLESMTPSHTVFTVPELADAVHTTAVVRVVDVPVGPGGVPKAARALAVLAAVTQHLDLFPVAALEAAAGSGAFAEANLEAVAAGVAALAGS
jgi:pyruvate/2-oxoacid:ferredoxin oxidoreductase beta subunit/Pyruvate/2-oxoacid:ferredoxin oxidoreductase gamma subunit